jgi:predicted NAD-dependent protein-ADP-ribosyltransferase YbiA (DUF1768 family)
MATSSPEERTRSRSLTHAEPHDWTCSIELANALRVTRARAAEHQYFGSGAGIYEISNLCEAPFTLWGYSWQSAEHAYQAASKCDPESWPRLAADGDLGGIDGLASVYKEKDKTFTQKKKAFWGARTNKKAMVGIVAKMAVKPKTAETLGLKLRQLPVGGERDLSRDLSRDYSLFTEILMAKYTANPEHRSKLLATGTKVLVEFNRRAKSETAAGDPPLWSGMWCDKTHEVVGTNLMGDIMMDVRTLLRTREASKTAVAASKPGWEVLRTPAGCYTRLEEADASLEKLALVDFIGVVILETATKKMVIRRSRVAENTFILGEFERLPTLNKNIVSPYCQKRSCLVRPQPKAMEAMEAMEAVEAV